MCGIAGFLDNKKLQAVQDWPDILQRMGQRVLHRGPDDSGVWTDPEGGIGLSHRRLSILDLSPAGHQPMASSSGRFIIIFNGEIYNHLELRKRIGARAWRGHSDTETLLAAIEEWGIESTLKLSVGMFAIAVWDRRERLLILARDRLGEKPLYYGWQGGTFLFGSELKALEAHPAFQSEVDRDTLALYLRDNVIAAPQSIFKGIRKLKPGTWVEISCDSQSETTIYPKVYWSLQEVARSGISTPFSGSPSEAVDSLEKLLSDSVRLQQLSDVPVGAFLSGGVDSTAIVALMQATSATKAKTFTIGFNEQGFDEAKHAKAIAQHLGTEHTEVYLTANQALEVIPRIPKIWDEPFADSSQIPSFLVASLAKQKVTVALSGDGGDELFGGYSRYQFTAKAWSRLSRIPVAFRSLSAGAIGKTSAGSWDSFLKVVLPRDIALRVTGDRILKMSEMISARSGPEFYRLMISLWKDPNAIVIGSKETPGVEGFVAPSLMDHMMLADGLDYLPNDILTKVDRSSMAVSLETRVPLLDHRVVELAWQLPYSIKALDGKGKWPLRALLYRYVPKELVDRPKKGFSVPIAAWLRGPLRAWADSLLQERRLIDEGFFTPDPIRRMWQEHQVGTRSWHNYLWNILMFQVWLESRKT